MVRKNLEDISMIEQGGESRSSLPAQKKLFIKSYGCQMNAYDAQRMEDILKPSDYESTSTYEDADVAILNTCHIREGASEKVYSHLGVLHKLKESRRQNGDKELLIGVVGCVAQAQGEDIIHRAPFVDFVLGPQAYHRLPEVLQTVDTEKKKKNKTICLDFSVEEKFNSHNYVPYKIIKTKARSSFVTVQEGCDKFCTFCVVPYTRGAEVSRRVEDIEAEVRALIEHGVREITLLGQNVNAYHGLDKTGRTTSLAGLIQKLASMDKLYRIFYTTSHPIDMTPDLIEAHRSIEKLMPYLHLPVQSGSNAVLKRMNRHYKVEDYLRIIDQLRDARADIALSSDFITGFPGESDQDHRDTVNLIKNVTFAKAFSFKYSRRPGTPAADADEQIDNEKALERLYEIQDILMKQQMAFNKKYENLTLSILVERINDAGEAVGKSPYLQSVYIKKADAQKIYAMDHPLNVFIEKSGQNSLQGYFV